MSIAKVSVETEGARILNKRDPASDPSNPNPITCCENYYLSGMVDQTIPQNP
jgi:hypothetical protein